MPREFIPRLSEHHRAGRFPIDRLVRRYPFEQIEDVVTAAERGEVVKPVLTLPCRSAGAAGRPLPSSAVECAPCSPEGVHAAGG